MEAAATTLFGGWIPAIPVKRAVDPDGKKLFEGANVVREDDCMIAVIERLLAHSSHIAADTLESLCQELGNLVRSQFLAGGSMASTFSPPQLDQDQEITGGLGGCPRIVVAFMLEAGAAE